MNAGDVSIVLPTHNGARYLRACLEAAVAQGDSVEQILVLDDRSTDATSTIVEEFARRDSRVSLVRNERRLGLVGNCNRGLSLARGTWVKFLFHDDMLAPECVARMREAAGDADLVVCAREVKVEDDAPPKFKEAFGGRVPSLAAVASESGRIHPADISTMILRMLRVGPRAIFNPIGEPTAVMVRRSMVESFGFLDPHLLQFCDLEYWLRIGCNRGIAYVPETLATFRVHARAASVSNHARLDFGTNWVDPLIMLHQFVYSPSYEALRAENARTVAPLDLERLLVVAAGETAARAMTTPETQETWTGVLARYPALSEKLRTTSRMGVEVRRILAAARRRVRVGA